MKKYNRPSEPSTFEDKFMRLALEEAKKAFDQNEVPVGCVIVNKETGVVVSQSRNLMQHHKNANFHAELIAINLACLKLDSKNLSECDIYITLEPCTMCAAAIANARVGRLYYAAADEKHGAVENGVRFFASTSCFHRPEIYSDILGEESANLMTSFFSKLRKNKL